MAVFFGEAALILQGQVIWINCLITVVAIALLSIGRFSVPMIVGFGAIFGVIVDAVI